MHELLLQSHVHPFLFYPFLYFMPFDFNEGVVETEVIKHVQQLESIKFWLLRVNDGNDVVDYLEPSLHTLPRKLEEANLRRTYAIYIVWQ